MAIEHDLKSLQVFIEGEFRADRDSHAQMHRENATAVSALALELARTTAQTTATNGRVQKLEIAVSMLKFAVYTIGGWLLYGGAQLVMAKLSSQ